jgi:hypothetical protein
MTRTDTPGTLTSFQVRRFAWLLIGAASGCAGEAIDPPGTLQVERITHGDTVIVRNLGGSVWGQPARLVEELRIGALEGPDEQIFGRIAHVAADGEGGAYVFDSQVPALRHYDRNGQFTHTIGGQGSGPGEYQDAVLGLWVRRDGRILMRDPRNARINVYAPDGTALDHWPVASGLFTSNAMTLDTAGHVYLKILMEQPERNRPWRIGLLHLDANGQLLDTIPDPPVRGEPQTGGGGVFTVAKVWTFSPHGYIIAGLNDTYAFELRKPKGILRVEMPHTTVAVHPEEREELEASNDWLRRAQGEFMTSEIPPVPDTKPAYRFIFAGLDGTVWVQPHTSAVKFEPPPRDPAIAADPAAPPQRTWREPVVYDAFDTSGAYLGQLPVPERTRLVWFNGSEIWAVQQGEFDEQYLVRFRLVTGAPEIALDARRQP